MVQAAARGVVDFNKADPRTRRFWRKLELVLARMEVDHETKLLELEHASLCAISSRSGMEQSLYQDVNRAVDRITRTLVDWQMPWRETNIETANKQVGRGMRSAWVAAFGDPERDPTVQAEIDKTVAYLMGKTDQNGQRTGAVTVRGDHPQPRFVRP